MSECEALWAAEGVRRNEQLNRGSAAHEGAPPACALGRARELVLMLKRAWRTHAPARATLGPHRGQHQAPTHAPRDPYSCPTRPPPHDPNPCPTHRLPVPHANPPRDPRTPNRCPTLPKSLYLDACDELCKQHQVQDDGRRQQRILARVVDDLRTTATGNRARFRRNQPECVGLGAAKVGGVYSLGPSRACAARGMHSARQILFCAA